MIYRLRNEPEVMNNLSIVLNNAATQMDGGIHTGAGGAMWPLAGQVVSCPTRWHSHVLLAR